MKKIMLLKLSITATLAFTSTFVAAAGGASTQASAELSWSGKVPLEFTGESVILTGLNGELLDNALKGGDLYVKRDGTFKSAGITLELHERMCGPDAASSAAAKCDGTNVPLALDNAAAVGALYSEAAWSLANVRYTVGGSETTNFDSATVNISSSALGTAESSGNGREVLTVQNETALVGEVLSATTVVSAFATIMVNGTTL